MDMNTVLIMGIAVAANIIIIKHKFENNRTSDAMLDALLLVLIGFVFSKTISGLMIGTVASAIISLYLLKFPPKQFSTSIFNIKD